MATPWVRFKRTLLFQILRDHVETFSTAIEDDEARGHVQRMVFSQYGWPIIFCLPFFVLRINLGGISNLLSGMAILTALLFALLVLMFDTTIALRKDGGAFSTAHGLKEVVTSLRMNVTYAVLLSILLSTVLLLAAAAGGEPGAPEGGLAWLWTPPLVFSFTHLGMTLILVLKRLRLAFNYIDR